MLGIVVMNKIIDASKYLNPRVNQTQHEKYFLQRGNIREICYSMCRNIIVQSHEILDSPWMRPGHFYFLPSEILSFLRQHADSVKEEICSTASSETESKGEERKGSCWGKSKTVLRYTFFHDNWLFIARQHLGTHHICREQCCRITT